MTLFEPFVLGQKRLPNRLVALPMETNLADDGHGPSTATRERYSRLAEAGWGAVFVEATSVTRTSVGGVRGLVLDERTAPAFQRLIGDFRRRDPSGLLLLQLTHSGRNSRSPTERTSVCPDPPAGLRYLSTADIEAIRRQFVEAGLLAERLGFDGVDVKCCHGYFGAEILRPANTRPDRWGSSFDNRVRFLEETVAELSGRRGAPAFLIGSRISCYENLPGGMGTAGTDTKEPNFAEIAELLRRMGALAMDFVTITTARPDPWPPIADLTAEEQQSPLLWFERLVKECVVREKLPLAVIGAGYSRFREEAIAVVEARLAARATDLPGWGRLTYADPLFPRKLREGIDVDWCKSCGGCSRLFGRGEETRCVIHPARERTVQAGSRSPEGGVNP